MCYRFICALLIALAATSGVQADTGSEANADLAAYRGALDALESRTIRHHDSTQTLPGKEQSAVDAERVERDRVVTRRDTLRDRIERPNTDPGLPCRDGREQAQLDCLYAEIERKSKELDERRKRAESVQAQAVRLRTAVATSNKQGIFVLVYGSRAIERKSPEFRATNEGYMLDCKGVRRRAIEVSRVVDGQRVEEALKDGGWFANRLSSANAATHYIRFLVTEDGIASFRRLRQFVISKGFAYNWDTDRDKPYAVFVEDTPGCGGGPIGTYPR